MSTTEGRIQLHKFKNNGWKYAGGDAESHKNYWKIFSRSINLPIDDPIKHNSHCICGHEIQKNCWIYKKGSKKNPNKHRFKVIGNECINRFMDKRRTCHICDKEHRNRVVNRCNECRIGLCDKCDIRIPDQYDKCYKCKFS